MANINLDNQDIVCLTCVIKRAPFKRTCKKLSSILTKISQKPKTLEEIGYKPITKDKEHYVKECDRAKDKEFWISKRNDNRLEIVIPDECESFDADELIAIATRLQELSNEVNDGN